MYISINISHPDSKGVSLLNNLSKNGVSLLLNNLARAGDNNRENYEGSKSCTGGLCARVWPDLQGGTYNLIHNKWQVRYQRVPPLINLFIVVNFFKLANGLFSSSNNQFYEFRISISPIKGVAKCFHFLCKELYLHFLMYFGLNLKLLSCQYLLTK